MSDQAVDIRAQFNKDVELLQQPLKVGDRVLSNGDLCELTQIGEDLIEQDPHVGTACVVQRISSRKRISTSGLRDLRITNG